MSIDPASEMAQVYLWHSFTANLTRAEITQRFQIHDVLSVRYESEALCRWLHSPRKLLKVTRATQAMLDTMEPRFGELPFCDEAPWTKGLMLHLPHATFCYVEPGPSADHAVRLAFWTVDSTTECGTMVLPGAHSASGDEWPAMPVHTSLDYALGSIPRLIRMPDEVRFPYRSIVILAVNVLAAYHADPEVIHGVRRRKQRKRRISGPVRNVKRYTLTEDGARLITRRWTTIPAPGGTGGTGATGSRGTPCLHTVEQHKMKVWVLKPGVDEKVLGTKDSVSKKHGRRTLYCVERTRGSKTGYTRGGGLAPKQGTMVTGLDDG